MKVGKKRNKKSYGSKQESACGYIEKGKDNINNLYYPKSIVTFSNASQKGKLHPTQKPVDLLEYLIKTYTNECETVLDFTAGSMSTAVACINTNRNCIMIEKDEHYYNVGKDRVISALQDKGLTLDNMSID